MISKVAELKRLFELVKGIDSDRLDAKTETKETLSEVFAKIDSIIAELNNVKK